MLSCRTRQLATHEDPQLSRKVLAHPFPLVDDWTLKGQDVWIGFDFKRRMRFEDSWSLPVVQGSARNAGNQEADRDPTPAVKDPKVVADPHVIREETVEAVVQNTLRHVRICLRGSTSDELTASTHQGDLSSP